MRTSLNEIKEIEAYLQHDLTISDRLVFEACMLVNKELRDHVALQRKIQALIQHHHRETLKLKFQLLHTKLFHDEANADLKKEILSLFNS